MVPVLHASTGRCLQVLVRHVISLTQCWIPCKFWTLWPHNFVFSFFQRIVLTICSTERDTSYSFKDNTAPCLTGLASSPFYHVRAGISLGKARYCMVLAECAIMGGGVVVTVPPLVHMAPLCELWKCPFVHSRKLLLSAGTNVLPVFFFLFCLNCAPLDVAPFCNPQPEHPYDWALAIHDRKQQSTFV